MIINLAVKIPTKILKSKYYRQIICKRHSGTKSEKKCNLEETTLFASKANKINISLEILSNGATQMKKTFKIFSKNVDFSL